MPLPKIGQVVSGYKYSGGNPNSQASWIPLSGDEFLSTVPPAEQPVIKAMVNGRINPPQGTVLKDPAWTQRLQWAMQYDPSFDETAWPTRVAMRKDVEGSGKQMQNLNALNTSIQHAALLNHYLDGVWGARIPVIGKLVNTVGNTAEDWSGDAGITDYRNVVNNFGHELRRTYTQTGAGSETDLKNYLDNMGENLSTDQKRGAIKTQMEMLSGKANSIAQQYAQTMGPLSEPPQVLFPATVTALKSMGMDPGSLGFAQGTYGGTAPAPQQSKFQEGQILHQNGNIFKVINGQPVYQTGAAAPPQQ